MGYYLLATSDYSGPTDGHLTFTKGTRIEFIERVENGMIKGRLEGKIGLLPSALITLDTRPLSVITNQPLVNRNPEPTPTVAAATPPPPSTSTVSSTVTTPSSPSSPAPVPKELSNNQDLEESSSSNSSSSNDLVQESDSKTSTTTTTTTTTTTATTADSFTPNTSASNLANREKLTSSTSSLGDSGNEATTNGGSTSTTSTNQLSNSMNSLQLDGAGPVNPTDSPFQSAPEKKKKKEDLSTSNVGLFRKSKSNSSTAKRRYANRKRCPRLFISKFEDLPDDIINDLKHEEIPVSELRKNIKVFLTIIKFLTRQKITYISPPSEKSENSKDGATAKKEIQTSALDEELELEQIKDETERKTKKLELKLSRKRTLTGVKPEFITKASTLVKTIPDIKKKMKFGQLIGKGGYGKVFEAQWEKKKVAIKVVHYRDAKEQLNVHLEIGFLNKCRHPNIVDFKGAVVHDGQMFIVTEFMQGGTLEQAVSSSHIFKETHIGYIGKEILKGIAYLHENKLVHRDIKSGNIMISLEGDIKLVDFGLCASVENGASHHMVGSPYWMPPEMIKGEPHSFPADVWSFGICMLEMMYRKPPHRESRFKSMFYNSTQGIDVTKFKCSLDLKDMLWQCFEMDPSKRSSANKLLRHPFFQRAETKQGMKGLFDNMFLQRNLNNTGFF
ncbi:putative protein serine/threonine kinase [Cavenderia fasciculata]|uniref:Protein kinase domain-containing protein n=1 Tax=Cavenderia fasciculata TaxID=261658 RepID=F4PNY6_CACFS|nr:putative protein serine/threonine kinase [Cavenderia fasciculata]EGG22665.1 putative protein serine/threonine kinase [Cavenderia fasciculata]|eukprot:XP_004360516.1 putative protein serine/threonine kinase [Cavenderia fasciculata]